MYVLKQELPNLGHNLGRMKCFGAVRRGFHPNRLPLSIIWAGKG